MGLIFLFFFIFESYLFLKLVTLWGFINVFVLYFAPIGLGLILLNYFGFKGAMALKNLSNPDTQSQDMIKTILHKGLISVGGILFLLPFFTTRVLGLFFIIPGLRHLVILLLKKPLMNQFSKFQTQGFNQGAQGNNHFGFKTFYYSSQWPSARSANDSPFETNITEERDVSPLQILDVKPNSISSTEVVDDAKKNET